MIYLVLTACHGYRHPRPSNAMLEAIFRTGIHERSTTNTDGLVGYVQPHHTARQYIYHPPTQRLSNPTDQVSFPLQLLSSALLPSFSNSSFPHELSTTCSLLQPSSRGSSPLFSSACSFKPVSTSHAHDSYCSLISYTAPMASTKRQLGDLQCNIARGEIVADILAMQSTVSTLAKQVSSYVSPYGTWHSLPLYDRGY